MKKFSKTEFLKRYLLPIEITSEGDFFLASCPVWSDCYAQGKTVDEATAEIVSVATSLVDLYLDEGLQIPLDKATNVSPYEQKKLTFDIPVFVSA